MYGRILSLTLGMMMALAGAWTLADAADETPEATFSTDAGSSTLFASLTFETSMATGHDVRDIELHGDLAYASGHSGLYIFDVSDPTAPVELGYLFCPARDVTVSGDVAAIVGEGNPGECGANNGVHLIDVSDPTDPTYTITFAHVDHTITAYGDTGIFHSSTQNLQPYCCPLLTLNGPEEDPPVEVTDNPGYQDIIIATDPDSASIQRFWFPQTAANGDVINSPGCHDIKFDIDLQRGYCAGSVETHIWDMTDPVEPVILSVIKNPSVSFHHSAVGTDAGDILVLGDEMGGALVTGCLPNSEGRNPNGALWFYDISDTSSPQVISWVSLPAGDDPTHMRCTSHFGGFLPNQQQLVWPWYIGGPVLVDFQDVTQPTILDSYVVDGADTWSAYYHDGYVFSGDTNRGFEVFSIS